MMFVLFHMHVWCYASSSTRIVREVLANGRGVEGPASPVDISDEMLNEDEVRRDPVKDNASRSQAHAEDSALTAKKEAIENAPTQDSFEIYRETVSLQEQKDFILQGLKANKILSLKKLVKKLETKIEIIVTFLALLEMIKQSEIICLQKENFKDVEIKLIIAEA